MTFEKPPITVLALFFDDIRLEDNGKSILIGHYGTDMVIHPGGMPVDRLAVFLVIRLPREFMPGKMTTKIDVPGQERIEVPFPIPMPPDYSGRPESAFAGANIQAVIHMRFAPLRAGDIIDVWLEVDGHDFPAGRLYVVDKPSAQMVFPKNDASTVSGI